VREPGLKLAAATAGEMRLLGARLAAALREAGLVEPFVLGLSGDLGAGKTTLVGGLLAALGHEGPARSPTYSLIEPYQLGGRDIYHCDLYRLRDPEELEDLGLRDLLTDRSLLLVEWPERAGERLRAPDLVLQLEYVGEGRTVLVRPRSDAGQRVAARLVLDLA
jgi:tRNA threonylcarbamoyladenosine biosynthesis protein TsaE